MRDEILLPSAPGAYAEWPTLVGAPTPWEAVRDLDGKYIASATAGQRHSFPVTLPVPAIANDETLVSAIYRASLATPALDTAQLLEPGFEEDPTTWVLGTTCAIGTAEIQDVIFRSGSRALMIARSTVGGVQRCGYAERLITGLIPGKQYQVKLWTRTMASTGGTSILSVRIDGVAKGVTSVLSTTWMQVVSTSFTIAGTSAMLRLWVPGAPPNTLLQQRFIDDVELVPVVPDVDAVVTPFYRLFGQDTDLASWTIPAGQTAFTAQADRPIAMYGYQLRNGAFELGVRNQNGAEVHLDQAKLDVSLRFARDRMGFVGGGGTFR